MSAMQREALVPPVQTWSTRITTSQYLGAVYGINIPDNYDRLATLTKKVLSLSWIWGVFVVCCLGYSGWLPWYSGLPWIGGGLLVACCGYFGAKNSDERLTCCFCGCSCLGSVLMIVQVVFALEAVRELEGVAGYDCKPDNMSSGCPLKSFIEAGEFSWIRFCHKSIPFQWTQIYLSLPVDSDEQCWQFVHDTLLPNAWQSLFVVVVFAIPTLILQGLGLCWGKELYDSLKANQVIHGEARVPTIRLQPVQPRWTQMDGQPW